MNKIKFGMLISLICSVTGHRLTDHDIAQIDELTEPQPSMDKPITVDSVNSLMTAIAEGKLIGAIKWHRTITGYSLRESKDVVEAAIKGSFDYWTNRLEGYTK